MSFDYDRKIIWKNFENTIDKSEKVWYNMYSK